MLQDTMGAGPLAGSVWPAPFTHTSSEVVGTLCWAYHGQLHLQEWNRNSVENSPAQQPSPLLTRVSPGVDSCPEEQHVLSE